MVFVSADREEADFKAYCEKMPWLALPFGARDIRSLLNDMLGIGGIPTLMLLDGEGGLISMDGVRLVSEDGAGERFPWSLDAVVGTLQPKLALLRRLRQLCQKKRTEEPAPVAEEEAPVVEEPKEAWAEKQRYTVNRAGGATGSSSAAEIRACALRNFPPAPSRDTTHRYTTP